MVALLVVMVPAAALGTPTQQQFQNYQSPTLGVSIQYPSDWKLLEESNDKLRFIKQEGFVTADLNVEEIDQSDATLPEYANTRVNELGSTRIRIFSHRIKSISMRLLLKKAFCLYNVKY
jgi:hypothetical protein